MKLVISTFILFFALSITAQNAIEKNPGDFDELKTFDLIDVKLIKSDETKIIITGKNKNDVKVKNDNGILKIRMPLKERFDGNRTEITLYYKEIDIIDANEGSYISSEDIFKQHKIELRAQEGGNIKVKVDITDADIKAVTGGEVVISGSADRQDISINTGGIVYAENLKTVSTYVAVRAAGEARVNASELVDAKIRIGGDIYIYGNPDKVNESRVIGGRIKRMQ